MPSGEDDCIGLGSLREEVSFPEWISTISLNHSLVILTTYFLFFLHSLFGKPVISWQFPLCSARYEISEKWIPPNWSQLTITLLHRSSLRCHSHTLLLYLAWRSTRYTSWIKPVGWFIRTIFIRNWINLLLMITLFLLVPFTVRMLLRQLNSKLPSRSWNYQ